MRDCGCPRPSLRNTWGQKPLLSRLPGHGTHFFQGMFQPVRGRPPSQQPGDPSAFKTQFSFQTGVLEGVCFTEYTHSVDSQQGGQICWAEGPGAPPYSPCPIPGGLRRAGRGVSACGVQWKEAAWERAPRVLQLLRLPSRFLRLEHNKSFVLYNKKQGHGP